MRTRLYNMHFISVIGALVTLWGVCEGLKGIGRTVKLTHTDRAMLINYHNDLRREVHASNMQELSWDREAARAARKWGRMCNYDRPRNDGYGYNIFYNRHDVSEPTSEVTMDALGVWSREKIVFNPLQSCVHTRSCDYLKMVTANVESVGCAVITCPVLRMGKSRQERDVNFVLCFYTPFIDVSRTEPYMHGEPCTYCRNGYSCRRGLCSPPLIPMGNIVIQFGDEYDSSRKSKINHVIQESSLSHKTDTPSPEENKAENQVSKTIGDKLQSGGLGNKAELRKGRTETRIYHPTSGQSNTVQNDRLQELTSSRVRRQTTRYSRYDPYAAERRRRRQREQERVRQHELRRKQLEQEQLRRQKEEERRRRQQQGQRSRGRQGQGQGPVEQRLGGGLSDNDEYYLLQLHNNIRTSGIAKLKWSSRLERWARYVIRCDTEYPGPSFCFTNFGKIAMDRPIYNIVYDWNAEGTDLNNELETGCRTPYDRSLCNHHLVMNNRDIREMACASLNCDRQRQVTCIYQ
ncbi:uncharacterized protein LOC110443193 isoform X1 [Mizuhopecten yessoensis]|uniref:Peptidase inhibitor 16 n=1 Tax=Mizuhopecten yessoensis TaxID=6573 RepID=A0A210PFJ1_MIZYE|nr:uncharacterized protein LOC110443193 isoform X1 [Mizuhopecten yessoensis]OWF35216.1 Peptidase inhibitor 16 [Mizuhopecten yessoensis]